MHRRHEPVPPRSLRMAMPLPRPRRAPRRRRPASALVARAAQRRVVVRRADHGRRRRCSTRGGAPRRASSPCRSAAWGPGLFNPISSTTASTPTARRSTRGRGGDEHALEGAAPVRAGSARPARVDKALPRLAVPRDGPALHDALRACPAPELRLSIDVAEGGRRVFRRHAPPAPTRDLPRRAGRVLWRYPMLTMRVSAGIHANALRLKRRAPPSTTTRIEQESSVLTRTIATAALTRLRDGTLTVVEEGRTTTFGTARRTVGRGHRARRTRTRFGIVRPGQRSVSARHTPPAGSTPTTSSASSRAAVRGDAAACAGDRLRSPVVRPLRDRAPRGSAEPTPTAANVAAHYDLANDLFELFLDPTMTYSCAVFDRRPPNLDEAQERKLDRVCRSSRSRSRRPPPRDRDGLGCRCAVHAAGRYGCRVTTTTISAEQHARARERVARRGPRRPRGRCSTWTTATCAAATTSSSPSR